MSLRVEEPLNYNIPRLAEMPCRGMLIFDFGKSCIKN